MHMDMIQLLFFTISLNLVYCNTAINLLTVWIYCKKWNLSFISNWRTWFFLNAHDQKGKKGKLQHVTDSISMFQWTAAKNLVINSVQDMWIKKMINKKKYIPVNLAICWAMSDISQILLVQRSNAQLGVN